MNALLRQFQNQQAEVQVLNVVEPISAIISASMPAGLARKVAKRTVRKRPPPSSSTCQPTGQGWDQNQRSCGSGDPKILIIENAAKWQADLIIMGSRGWSILNEFPLESVSEAVVRHTPCSVEVVRKPIVTRGVPRKSKR
jgi:nucleotide-binding universal stress UspA family protein